MAHLNNKTNEYVRSLDPGVFDAVPKSIWAAIAISYATCGGDHLEDATQEVLREWNILHINGIVPQKPPKGLTVEP